MTNICIEFNQQFLILCNIFEFAYKQLHIQIKFLDFIFLFEYFRESIVIFKNVMFWIPTKTYFD